MATEALTADTNTRCLPWTYCLPLLPVPLCCTNCDGKNGAGQGAGAFVQCAMCWCMHSGEWTGLYDQTETVRFELSDARGLVVHTSSNGRRTFSRDAVEAVALYTSICEHRLVPTTLSGERGESVPCSSGAVLVDVYGPPSPLFSGAADELQNPSLPSLIDILCDPLPSARARLSCLANFAFCGCCIDGENGAPPLKRVRCVFLGARIRGKGVVRLSQRAWRAASVAKLAAVAEQIHRAFPPLLEAQVLVQTPGGEVAVAKPVAPTGPRGKPKAPTPLKMDERDRMAYDPPSVITSAESKGSVAGMAG